MYEKESNSGHKVVWKPDNEEAAKQAMEDEGLVPDNVELPEDANVPLDPGEARRVRERYAELTEDEEE